MFTEQLINKDIPHLKPEDTGTVALDIMETYKISHLPIVDSNRKLVGIVSESDIFDFQLENKAFNNAKIVYKRFFVYKNASLYEVLNVFKKYNTTIVPVLDSKENFLGFITPFSIVKFLLNTPMGDEKIFSVYIETNIRDYSSTQIANIIEANNSYLMGLIYVENEDKAQLLLKIKSDDIVSVIQSFEHFNYEAKLLNISEEKYDEFYKERLDNLLKFINI